MYVAAVTFVDLKDGRRLYHAGDVYPRDGLAVSQERLAELSGSDNRMGYPMITAVHDEAKKEPAKKPVKKATPRKRVSKHAD